jgi:hypothetical protein
MRADGERKLTTAKRHTDASLSKQRNVVFVWIRRWLGRYDMTMVGRDKATIAHEFSDIVDNGTWVAYETPTVHNVDAVNFAGLQTDTTNNGLYSTSFYNMRGPIGKELLRVAFPI